MTARGSLAAAWGLAGVAVLASGAGGCASSPVRPADPAIARVFPALVRIHVVMEEAEEGRMQRQMGAGSGAIVTPDGYVVTNHHVAGKARHLKVTLADLQEIDADLVGTDPLSDIAVIKLRLDQRKDPKAPLAVAAWGDSDAVQVGDAVFALGSPMALSQSVTEGIVSNTRMIIPGFMAEFFKMDGEPVGSVVRWIGHDAVIYGGNSGGPLVDGAGRIVGVNEIGIGSLGGAIPANLARSVADQLIRTGRVERAWTGIEIQPRLKAGGSASGVLVAGVLKGSPAEQAGIRAGDVIVRFDGVDVDGEVEEQLPAFNRLVMGTPVGKRVEVRLVRGGGAPGAAAETVTVPLQTVVREKTMADAEELKAWGIAARDLTTMARLRRERESRDGVLVQSVRPGKPAASAEPALKEDDVILGVDDAPVRDLASLQAATAAALKDGKPRKVLVRFERGRSALLTVVELGRDDDPPPPASARKGWLPVATQVLTPPLAEKLGMADRKGVRVTRVLPRPKGEACPLQVGDVIVAVDGKEVRAYRPQHDDVFPTMIRQYRPGDKVVLDVLRGGKEEKVETVLAGSPAPSEELPRLEDKHFEFTTRGTSDQEDLESEARQAGRGVLVDRVETGGWASLAGLRTADTLLAVNGRPTPSIAALREALAALRKEQPRHVVFFVRRGVQTRYLEVEPSWKE
jgi:serine protease Do